MSIIEKLKWLYWKEICADNLYLLAKIEELYAREKYLRDAYKVASNKRQKRYYKAEMMDNQREVKSLIEILG
jgi:hypothetical protein